MRRLISVLLSAFFGLVLATTAVFADSPNFHFANSSVSSTTGALSVSFKETGLGTTVSTETITLNVASASAVYQCFNNGNNHPAAANKTGPGVLTTTGTFPVRNGQTTGTISGGPPTSTLKCPNGQTRFLVAVSYDGISLTGAAGDTINATPFNIDLTGLKIQA
ncbi:hypothetical protein F7Q99_09150 [Streptomyces kaniharaensis]|uniref:Uncharacterized protein n=1 Tax=Streptomyces kaniharaensis TaxID=212423 RepID=A0A6N7KPG1_9ACTN|nr:hypothetical protein [Streptomyces kaniharaensis]MQS12449.1 hypothetical protein [Streptomyces kaniharaensis]